MFESFWYKKLVAPNSSFYCVAEINEWGSLKSARKQEEVAFNEAVL